MHILLTIIGFANFYGGFIGLGALLVRIADDCRRYRCGKA